MTSTLEHHSRQREAAADKKGEVGALRTRAGAIEGELLDSLAAQITEITFAVSNLRGVLDVLLEARGLAHGGIKQ